MNSNTDNKTNESASNFSDTCEEPNNLCAEIPRYAGMTGIIEQTKLAIHRMDMHTKKSMRDLVDEVRGNVTDASTSAVHNIVQMYCQESKDVEVEVGRNGGVWRGGKPKRTDDRQRCATCSQIIRHDMKTRRTLVDKVRAESDDDLAQYSMPPSANFSDPTDTLDTSVSQMAG